MRIQAVTKDGFVRTLICRDEEIAGRIYGQATYLLQGGFVDNDQKSKLLNHITSEVLKLEATKYHLGSYLRTEEEMSLRWQKTFQERPHEQELAFELIFEIEAFLLQMKSSLDMLPKILEVFLGPGRIKKATFGDKGNCLIKSLEQYKKQAGVNAHMAQGLIATITNDRDSWMAKAINLRDTVAHWHSLSNFAFRPEPSPDGTVAVARPRLELGIPAKLLPILYRNNLEFHQDFVAISITLAHEALRLVPEDPKTAAIVLDNHPSARFIKYRLDA